MNPLRRWAIEKYGSLAALAIELGVTRQYVWLMTSDKAKPGREVLTRLQRLSDGRFDPEYWARRPR